MRTYAELQAEITRLNQLKHLDESGVTVRLITLIALGWAIGKDPTSPSDRLIEVSKETAFDGAVDTGGGIDGEGDR